MRSLIRTHLMQHRYAGDPDLVLTRRGNLPFHWAIALDGAIHESDVHVRADHALDRGARLPESWHIALRVRSLGSPAAEAARVEFALSDDTKLDCRQALCYNITLSTRRHTRANVVLQQST